MASMDIVNELDLQRIDNAINVAGRKMGQRYDFRGLNVSVTLDKKEKKITIEAPDESKLKAVQEIVMGCFIDQKVPLKCIEWGKHDAAHMGAIRQHSKLVEGIDRDVAKKIQGIIKDSGLKVQVQIQGESLRVTGKKIDDLQAIMKTLQGMELPVPLQFTNYKS